MPSNVLPRQLLDSVQSDTGFDNATLEAILPLVYDELHKIARRYMRRERPEHTLQTSALINEAYMRLAGQRNVHWQNRSHFLGIASQLMRRILVDHARSHNDQKHGAGALQVSLAEAESISNGPAKEVVQLDEALRDLEELDPRQARVVELRYFGGLSIIETAEALGISVDMVKREWSTAKVWLLHRLQ